MQGPKTPTPDSPQNDHEEIFADLQDSTLPLIDRDGKTLDSCRASSDAEPFQGFPRIRRVSAEKQRYDYVTSSPEDPIPELFPLDANFQTK